MQELKNSSPVRWQANNQWFTGNLMVDSETGKVVRVAIDGKINDLRLVMTLRGPVAVSASMLTQAPMRSD